MCRYDEIRNLYVEQLAYVWVQDRTEDTRTSIEKKLDNFVEGNLKHAMGTVSALWGVVKKDGEIMDPSRFTVSLPRDWTLRKLLIPPDKNTQAKNPAHWDSVKIALIKSIRTGVFFDRKCWARCSTSGDMLKPVYLSSTIMNDKTKQVNRCTLECIFCNTEVLNIFSGKVLHWSEYPHEQSRGRRRRERL